jgi:hypothetical protein
MNGDPGPNTDEMCDHRGALPSVLFEEMSNMICRYESEDSRYPSRYGVGRWIRTPNAHNSRNWRYRFYEDARSSTMLLRRERRLLSAKPRLVSAIFALRPHLPDDLVVHIVSLAEWLLLSDSPGSLPRTPAPLGSASV